MICNVIASGYEWMLDGKKIERTSQRIYVNQAGIYTVSVKDRQGCISDKSTSFSFVLTANDTYLSTLVKVYPNPNSGRFTLLLPVGLGKEVRLSIYDAVGRKINTTLIHSNSSDYQQQVDLASQESGMYLIRLETSKQVIIKRVFKK